MSIAKSAPISACTPAAMAAAGVPFVAAHHFHCRIRQRGTRNRTEISVLQFVRKKVGAMSLPT